MFEYKRIELSIEALRPVPRRINSCFDRDMSGPTRSIRSTDPFGMVVAAEREAASPASS
jgi:hypothetical protein